MNLEATVLVYAGGPGSGCRGSNCGRKKYKEICEKGNACALTMMKDLDLKIDARDFRVGEGMNRWDTIKALQRQAEVYPVDFEGTAKEFATKYTKGSYAVFVEEHVMALKDGHLWQQLGPNVNYANRQVEEVLRVVPKKKT
jgi:hypothetical protein